MALDCSMGSQTAVQLGVALAAVTMPHDLSEHGGDRCRELRIEIAAFIAHCLHLGPSDMKVVRKRMEEHLRRGCGCGDGREELT